MEPSCGIWKWVNAFRNRSKRLHSDKGIGMEPLNDLTQSIELKAAANGKDQSDTPSRHNHFLPSSGESVTYVSGMKCYPSLGKATRLKQWH
jgi:hypothetical protein